MMSRTARCVLAVTPLLVSTALFATQTQPAPPPASRPSLLATPSSQPAPQPATQPAVPLATVRALFDRTLKTAETTEATRSLAGTTQALAHYRRAQQLLERFPALDVDPPVRERIPAKISQLQAQMVQAHAARRAAASQPAYPAQQEQQQRMPPYVPGRANQPNYGAGMPIPAPGPF